MRTDDEHDTAGGRRKTRTVVGYMEGTHRFGRSWEDGKQQAIIPRDG